MIDRLWRKVAHYHTALGPRGVAAFLWSKVSRTQPTFRLRIPGARHPVSVRIGTTDISVLRQVLQECHYDVALPFTPATVIDAGANIGLAAIFFANRYPDAQIVAIEPDESNARLLTMNAAPYPNIRVLQAALWARDEPVRLFDPGSGHHGFQVQANAVERGGTVQAFRVDTLMQQMGWSKLDLLKIDIEGAEREVFDDSPRWIGVVNACMAELHDHLKPGCSDSFGRAVAGFEGRTTKGESVVVWRAKDDTSNTVS